MGKISKDIRGVFLSPRTTIFLLVCIALVSMIGAFIPQQRETDFYLAQYGDLYRLFDFLGVIDIFHSWWFQLLLLLLMVNLIACSVSRFPMPWKVGELTKRQWIGRLGPTITHFSIIIILVGSLIGNTWGFKGYMNIPVGESRNGVILKNSDRLLNLDFTIRCDKFKEVKYPGSQITKEDLSELAILENGREELKKTIRINDPLTYKGISFYQSGHGVIPPKPGEVKTELEIIPKGDNSSGHRLQIAEGERKQIPGTEYEVQLGSFLPDFGLGDGNRPFSRSDQPRNPAVQVNIYCNGNFTFNGWSFLNFPDFHGSRDDSFRVKFINFSGGKLYTGLMVVKDPGIWVVWTGFGLLMIGISLSFGFRRKSSPKGGKDD